MFGRRSRPQRAGYLRRSRASSEVTFGIDAPAPVRKTSPEDGGRSERQLLRPRRSQEERKQVCWPEDPATKGRLPPARPCVPGGNFQKRCTNSCKEVFTGGQQEKWAPTPVRKSSPEDSHRSQRQLRQHTRSPEPQAKSSADGLQRTAPF